jgi:hypothetical protein
METEKVHLTKEKETYLASLYGKALDSRVFRIDPPARHNYTMIGSSVTDLQWLDEIPLLFISELVDRLSQSQSWVQRMMYRIKHNS